MRCDCCPLCPIDDYVVCLESEGKYGIEHADGMSGCRHPRNWAEKRNEEYCNNLGEMGTDMGIEMMFSKDDFEEVIDLCERIIGLNYSKPYRRHGKAFYKTHRNYLYTPTTEGNMLLDRLSELVIEREETACRVCYKLTPDGLKWLGRQLNITIKEAK